MKAKWITSVHGNKLHCIVWLGKRHTHHTHYFALPEDTDPDELKVAIEAAVEIIQDGKIRINGVDIG